ncbi:MAG: hypothetical protein JNL21_14080 [Myxococcales bacterium]|nr:hypothetical protein [Myxococcales bacterium]
MQIDAARFFALVAAITAACSGADPDAQHGQAPLEPAASLATPPGSDTPPRSNPATDPAVVCDRRWDGPSPCDEVLVDPAHLCWDLARALSPEDGVRAAVCLEREVGVHGLCGGLTYDSAVLLCLPPGVGTESDLEACRPLAAKCSAAVGDTCAGFSAALLPDFRAKFAEILRNTVAMPATTLADERECRETLATVTQWAVSPK